MSEEARSKKGSTDDMLNYQNACTQYSGVFALSNFSDFGVHPIWAVKLSL
jgi:hypothetical protein